MPDLYVTAALPNPAGKDRPRYGAPSNDQLNSEWIEFTNPTNRTWNLETVGLSHYTWDRWCQKTGENPLTPFSGQLKPGHSVRVHTGSGSPQPEGNRHHVYLAKSNYAWNNACGDTVVLRGQGGVVIDWASYSANPPEGQILHRVSGTNTLS